VPPPSRLVSTFGFRIGTIFGKGKVAAAVSSCESGCQAIRTPLKSAYHEKQARTQVHRIRDGCVVQPRQWRLLIKIALGLGSVRG